MNQKAKILVIDDDELVLATVRTMLMRARYDVALASSGHDGITQLLGGRFDLVLCDIVMAAKDGLSTLRGLKAVGPAVPVIMMVGGTVDEGAVRESGMDYLGATLAIGAGVIEKPFHGSNLVALVYDCLAHRSVSMH
jgi:DNA-binding NtrC family response regulator